MRPLITIIVGTLVLAACSSAGSPSSSPVAGVPSVQVASPAPTSTMPPSIAPPTAVPSPPPTSGATVVDLAGVEIRPIATLKPASGCTADDWDGRSLNRAMTIADTPISFQFQSGASREDGGGVWSDGVPGPPSRFDATEEHQTVEAQEGAVVRLEPASSITLIDGRLELYRLDANDHAGDGLLAATVDLGGDVDGLDIPLPKQAGRWLLNVYAHWQTDCATGDGYVDLLLITT